MKTNFSQQEEYESAKRSVQEVHNFYLIAFVFVVMMIYLHWLDLKDGLYDWAFWPAIGFSASMIWFAAVMLPSNVKNHLIIKNLHKTFHLNQSTMNSSENYSVREYEKAKKSVEEKIGFYIHLSVYVLVNLFLVFICLNQGGYFWATWSLFGWGIGLFFHGMKVFRTTNNSHWKERQIRKEMEKRRKINH